MPTPELTLHGQAEPAVLDEVHGLLLQLWQLHPEVEDATRLRMDTAVAEVAANIVQHGGPGVELVLDLTVDGARIYARFVDSGGPVAPVILEDARMPHDAAESGRGLAIARALLDELTYRREDGWNTWLLVRDA